MNINELTLGQIKEVAQLASTLGACGPKQGEASTPSPTTEKPVLVTTIHRGVFFGYSTGRVGDTIKLRNARNVVYWTAENKGFLGLAESGPTKGAKVGPAANIELLGVASVAECSSKAVEAFEAAPWEK